MSELKPCPFCGGEVSVRGRQWGEDIEYVVKCRNIECIACNTHYLGEHDAINAWNRRADDWIPVSEKMENGKVVLIQMSNIAWPIVGHYSKTYECLQSLSGGQYPLSLGTYYHELPAAPKGDAK